MNPEQYGYYYPAEEPRNVYEQCKRYMNYHAMLTMNDGSQMDGIIEEVNGDSVNVLVGEDVMEPEEENYGGDRQFYGGYGGPRRRFRRFRRRNFPLAALATIALLPYIIPPYYPYGPYPYY
ncbi:hypothetical protein [Alteribacillus sp. HJP-4]|uniref:hypothetical protein n=1 Tax=Alteribacillus sp. HJP-4 TaxID=2775394 RepID=UPI0035CD0FA0